LLTVTGRETSAMKTLVTAALVFTTFTAALAQSVATPAAPPDRAQVERAQRALKDAGHDPGAIDGVMGARTSAALKAYQTQQGLDPTGRLDDRTAAKLGAAEPSASVKPSPADPAQGTKTGANVGEGASYSRSTEKK
jgi:peptidoglycan hydrolase-like protein with peptidoglycan-binding domain